MATRQYIGARYVLKVYTNSHDPSSAEWESGVVYEPLTMVTYQNSSFVSRSQVPASAGNPAVATTYWAITGAYNGQIASLQSQIDTINNNIDIINGDGIIFMGDSYGTDEAIPSGDGWGTILRISYPTSAFLIQGGTGFASDLYMSTNWLGMLQAYAATLRADQKKAVKQIVIAGGANDANLILAGTLTTVALRAKITEFVAWVKANLPNAVIKCAFIGWYRNATHFSAYQAAIETYKEHRASNYTYFGNGEFIMRNNAFIETDHYLHPINTQISAYLAAFISSMVRDGVYVWEYYNAVTMDVTTRSDIVHHTDHITTMDCYYSGSMASFFLSGDFEHDAMWRIIFQDNTELDIGDSFTVGTLLGTPTGHVGQYMVPLMCHAFGMSSQSLGWQQFYAIIQNNQLYFKFMGTDNNMVIKTVLMPWISMNMNLSQNKIA